MLFLFYLDLYNCLDPYTGRSEYHTVPSRGLKPMNMAKIRYGLGPYTYHKEYGHSRIRLTALLECAIKLLSGCFTSLLCIFCLVKHNDCDCSGRQYICILICI